MSDSQTLRERELTRLALRRVMRFALIGELIFIALYAFLLNPLYTYFDADVLYADAWWLSLIGLAIDVSEYVPFAILYPASIYTLWRGGWRRGWPIVLLSVGMTVLKFLINYAVGLYVDQGAFPSFELLADDASLILPSLLLELVQYGLVLGLTSLQLWLYRCRQADIAAEAALRRITYEEPSVLPLTRFWERFNPVQRSLFDMALSLTVLSLFLRRLIYQLVLWDNFEKTDGVLQITVDVLGDLIMGLLLYLVGILLVNRFARRDRRDTPSA